MKANDVATLKAWCYYKRVETDAFTDDVKLAMTIEGVIFRMEKAEAALERAEAALEDIARSEIGSDGKKARDALSARRVTQDGS